ncbi:probable serine/threonine-protein kinase PBL11 [Primulina huaijiensis]|uniref:probable serine/threonine-protein kinase PBL11 n=1 Tax=Primulina huaijiensis TaxID=1492673 RepID=UPI003CC7940F
MENREAFSPVSTFPRLQNHKTESRNGHLYGGITVAIVLVFVVGWLCFCFRRKLVPSFPLCGRRRGGLDAEKLNLRRFRLEELRKATNNFSEEFLVGNGAFSNVYCGTFGVNEILAIKKPLAESYTTTEEFRNEVRLLSKVKHNNTVRLVGFCEENGPKAAKILVYEYVSNGSLLDYIMGRGGRSLTWRQRVDIAIGAAKGIAHLHDEVKPGIIHRDIKPSNILISDRFEAKVSDFGLVRSGPVGDQSHVSSLVKGTPGYLDPAYCSSFHLTPFTDVYSFGVILLQLVVARPAVESTGTHIKSHIIDRVRPSIEKGNIEEILDANLLLEGYCNMDMMLKMGQLGLKCVAKEPKERPTMSRVWQELEANLNLQDHFSPKQNLAMDPPRLRSNQSTSIDCEYSQSIVSIDGIGLQRFHVDVDSLSFQSASLRCLETSMSMDEEGQRLAFDG